jgi:Zn-dependent peptidase ImmA (M78 family)
MLLATELGHLLMDAPLNRDFAIVSGPWTFWPIAARARAFAAMLLMPEEGVRDVVTEEGGVTAVAVRRIMGRFGTGPRSTTWHLKNLDLISEEARADLLIEVSSPGAQ